MYSDKDVKKVQNEWSTLDRWKGIQRPYSAEDVVKLRGSLHIDYPVARHGAEKFWDLLSTESFVRALGALTGNQAVQQVDAGLKAIYVSGWQVAADNNDALETYPDQSLYPYLSVPHLVRRISNALRRADQVEHMDNKVHTDWFVPIIADAEAGFGGPLNVFELVKAMISAGTAAIHLEDQLSSLKKCGHMGGKVLEPANIFTEKLITARLASDVMNIPTLIIARTDAHSAGSVRSDADPLDAPFLTGERTPEGYFVARGGVPFSIARALAFAPYCDIIWSETPTPDLGEAKEFADEVHRHHPGKWLAYNCSPSFNWRGNLGEQSIQHFQEKLGEMGYKFQFVTLAGFHTLNASMFELSQKYAQEGMKAYSKFQEHEFDLEEQFGYKGIKHQKFVGTGYYDLLTTVISQGKTSTTALTGSTEEAQFNKRG